MIRKFLIIILLTVNVPLSARDIDLDGIYLEKGTPIYSQIVTAKEKLFSDISSLYIDSNVIFAEWSGGNDIIYIREFRGVNIVYRYTRNSRKKQEVVRFAGTVTSAFLSRYGDTLYAKTLFYNDDAEAESETIVIDVKTGSISIKKSGRLFLDFTLHPSGYGIVCQTGDGIVKSFSFDGESKLLVKRDDVKSFMTGSDPVLAFVSPDEKKTVLVSGSGGVYSARLLTPSGQVDINGISSGSDLKWIDSSRFIYRSGGGGDYSVNVYDVKSGKSKMLISGTMNPDINYSEIPGLITCLDNQMITVFSRDLKKRIDTGIEGEESFFSPDGVKFTSIYLGRLYINSLSMVQKYRIEIRRNAETLLSLYRHAAKDKSSWQNDYTSQYIGKKIRQYEKFLKMTEKNR
jgi:hypothetical protein